MKGLRISPTISLWPAALKRVRPTTQEVPLVDSILFFPLWIPRANGNITQDSCSYVLQLGITFLDGSLSPLHLPEPSGLFFAPMPAPSRAARMDAIRLEMLKDWGRHWSWMSCPAMRKLFSHGTCSQEILLAEYMRSFLPGGILQRSLRSEEFKGTAQGIAHWAEEGAIHAYRSTKL